MSRFFLFFILLLAAVTTRAQQLILEPVLLAESEGAFYILTSLSLWEEGRTLVEGELEAIGLSGGEITEVFRCGLSVEDVMMLNEEGLPLYWASNTEEYGCLVVTDAGLTMYTGEIGRNWDPDLKMYLSVYLPLSEEGILQEYLGAETMREYLTPPY